MRSLHLFLLSPLLAAAVACSPTAGLSKTAATGQQVSADVTVAADGSLHAARVFVDSNADGEENDDGEEADGGVDCEDGLTADGAECDGGPAANQDDGEEADAEESDAEEADGGVDCIDGLTVDGAECDGGPAANQDDGEEADAAESGGQGADGTARSRSFVQGQPVFAAERGVYQLLGLDVNAGANAVGAGGVRFVGKYDGNSLFSASAVQTGKSGFAIGGPSEGILDHGDGTYTLTLLGRPVSIDHSTQVRKAKDPLEVDDGEESDDEGGDESGVDCIDGLTAAGAECDGGPGAQQD